MGHFEELWLYCRETLDVVKEKRFLFIPKLMYTAVIFLLFMLAFGRMTIMGLFLGRPITTGFPWASVIVLLLGMLAGLLFNAGEVNLYSRAAMGHSVGIHDFCKGIGLFTERIFLGTVMIFMPFFLVGMSMLIFASFPGLRVLAVIFYPAIVFLIIVFLSVWKAAMAFKDLGVVDAFRDSYRFVKGFFWPMALVGFINRLFNGSGKNNRGNSTRGGLSFNGLNIDLNVPGFSFGSLNWWDMTVDALALIPLIIVFSIIGIVINVYIQQLIFVIYARREGIGTT